MNSSKEQPVAGSFEEAALVALGELFRIYGTEASPAPLEVSGEIDTHDGQVVWRLDGTYEVTVLPVVAPRRGDRDAPSELLGIRWRVVFPGFRGVR